MRRFALLAGSVICVVMLAALAVYADLSSSAEAKHVHSDDRTALQSTLAGLTQQYIEFTFLTTQTAAQDASWTLQPHSAADRQALRSIVRNSPLDSYGAAVVSLGGTPLSTFPSASALPPPTDPGFTSMRRDLLLGQPGLSDVMNVHGDNVVGFAVPIIRSKQPVALLVTFANLQTWPLQGYDSKLQVGSNAASYVLDSKGVVAAASNPGEIGAPVPGLAQSTFTGSTGIRTIDRDGTASVVSVGSAGQGWSTATVQPESAFSGALDHRRQLQLLALAVLMSFVVLWLTVFHYKRQRALAKLAEERLYDPLTGLAQRGAFELRLRASLARRRRHERPLAVLFCDLDDFKDVNDRNGHNTGDQLLVAVAERITDAVRETDMVVRLGGDEFAVVMEETSPDETRRVSQRIRAMVGSDVDLNGRPYTPRLSVGGAVLMSGEPTLDEVLHEADMAMYDAKRHGTGCVVTTMGKAPAPAVGVPAARVVPFTAESSTSPKH
jgi:diguanylate cyclase (GGDEF)-like protein